MQRSTAWAVDWTAEYWEVGPVQETRSDDRQFAQMHL